MTRRGFENLVTGVTAKLPGDYGPLTDAEIKHAAQFRPGSVEVTAAVEIGEPLPGGLPPGAVPEYQFDGTRKWRFDWAWPAQRVALEIEGGIYGRGKKCPACGRRAVAGHTSIQRLKTDMEKYNAAVILGWRLIRVTPDQFNDGSAAALVAILLRRETEQ